MDSLHTQNDDSGDDGERQAHKIYIHNYYDMTCTDSFNTRNLQMQNCDNHSCLSPLPACLSIVSSRSRAIYQLNVLRFFTVHVTTLKSHNWDSTKNPVVRNSISSKECRTLNVLLQILGLTNPKIPSSPPQSVIIKNIVPEDPEITISDMHLQTHLQHPQLLDQSLPSPNSNLLFPTSSTARSHVLMPVHCIVLLSLAGLVVFYCVIIAVHDRHWWNIIYFFHWWLTSNQNPDASHQKACSSMEQHTAFQIIDGVHILSLYTLRLLHWYTTIHRYETSRSETLLNSLDTFTTDSISWMVFECVKTNEDDNMNST